MYVSVQHLYFRRSVDIVTSSPSSPSLAAFHFVVIISVNSSPPIHSFKFIIHFSFFAFYFFPFFLSIRLLPIGAEADVVVICCIFRRLIVYARAMDFTKEIKMPMVRR